MPHVVHIEVSCDDFFTSFPRESGFPHPFFSRVTFGVTSLNPPLPLLSARRKGVCLCSLTICSFLQVIPEISSFMKHHRRLASYFKKRQHAVALKMESKDGKRPTSLVCCCKCVCFPSSLRDSRTDALRSASDLLVLLSGGWTPLNISIVASKKLKTSLRRSWRYDAGFVLFCFRGMEMPLPVSAESDTLLSCFHLVGLCRLYVILLAPVVALVRWLSLTPKKRLSTL